MRVRGSWVSVINAPSFQVLGTRTHTKVIFDANARDVYEGACHPRALATHFSNYPKASTEAMWDGPRLAAPDFSGVPPLHKDFYLRHPDPFLQTEEYCFGGLQSAHPVIGQRTEEEAQTTRKKVVV